MRAARLAVVSPYWTFWEHTLGPGTREQRLGVARRVAGTLSDLGEVACIEELASPESGRALAQRLRPAPPDAVLVLQAMAVPPSHALALLEQLPGVPVVVCALSPSGALPAEVDHGTITAQGATVGAPMLTNVMSRRGLPFDLVLAREGDPVLREPVRAALAAGRLRRARLGRVGRPLEGYLHVDADNDALRWATGIEMVEIPPAEVLERYRDVPADRVRELTEQLRAWDVAPDVDEGEGLQRSLRVAVALEDLVADHRLDAGAMNCHVPEIRFSEEIGVTPCYGLGRLTSAGVPWTCTGDVVTAVALLTTKLLGGAAVYHEIETVDHATGEVVLANSGEHDLTWLAPGARPALRRNGWFCGVDPRCGVCATFPPAPGPATLVGFTPHPAAPRGFRYVVARGELTARSFPATGTVNGAFRFASGSVAEAWGRWARAGVNHHSSATPGDLADAVTAVARHLGLEAVEA